MKYCSICEENFKDELTNCPKCGHTLMERQYVPKVQKISKFSVAICILGILLGLYLFIISFINTFDSGYSGGGYETFGADFYTDTYKQITKVVDNTENIITNLEIIWNNISKGLGGFITLYFSLQLSKILNKN